MSFDRSQHGTVTREQSSPSCQRRTFLDELRLELRETYGLSSGVVVQEGGMVLFVVTDRPDKRSVEIGCDIDPDGWWYTWAAETDHTIAPVEDMEGAAKVIVHELRKDSGAAL